MPKSLGEFFLEHFRQHKRECAYRQKRGYRMESFTYGDILGMAQTVGGELAVRNIVKGDRVMLWGQNSAEWVAAFLGCALHGVVVVPMDDAASVDFALRVSRQVEAKLAIGSPEHGRECANASLPTLLFEDLAVARHSLPAVPEVQVGPDEILQIIFTSGTTAEPKGVVITHGNVLANIAPLEREMRGYMKYERWVHPVRFLNLLPLSHVFGQFLGMFLPPLLGGTVIFQEELKPSDRKSVV